MQHTHPRHFDLETGLLKLLLMITVLLCLFYVLKQSVAVYWALSIVLLTALFSFYLRPKSSIRRLSHLTEDLWSLEDQYQHRTQQRLLKIQSLGIAVFLTFVEEHTQNKTTLCIMQDQLNHQQWCRLQRLVRHQ
ncbi:hypothetical protein F4V57_12175 [Acinetobacter qingfengensis]|uniref:Uncharacterized protein n=1 Tax=Acinetobacter qingfengensis TaxID=1262585 RepID=A0A1E7QXJ1_9GAMM|nr:protein YgfX [Acinetobacter qingfengensis]KAA8731668.1 hypothetical protein F4V57_12175 [Acinetobacter qingfengensis]OEY91769.1 hypothetical protein BJI46_06425 [Acinetobacter qingfengensis]